MITRSKLVEQLREYQIRSQHKCPALTIFSPKPLLTTWFNAVMSSRVVARLFTTFQFYSVMFPSLYANCTIFVNHVLKRVDVVGAILWASLFSVLLISSYVTLYFRHYWLSFVIVCLGIFLPVRLRISRQELARKKESILPLSF